jgi:hypothetical protein
MTPTIPLAARRAVEPAITGGLLAGVVSTAILLWRGRTDARRAVAPINAISHWFWPREALRQDQPTIKHTATGAAVHYASSLLWSTVYGWVRARRRRPTPLNAVVDAAAVTAVAAAVDLAVVPERFTPGFEHRLSRSSLSLVYASFAAGLALGGLLALRR